MNGRLGGIETWKDLLEIAVRPCNKHCQTANSEEAFPELCHRFRALELAVTVLEVTGGLDRTVVTAMEGAKLRVALVNLVRHEGSPAR